VPPVLGQSYSYPQLASASDQAAAAGVGKGAVIYPQNLTLQNLAYFMIAPTLIYQLNYPRREEIRWSKLGQWVVALVLGGALYAFIIDQYFIPSMVSGMRPFNEMNYMSVTGREGGRVRVVASNFAFLV
jgi:diacylglycerol O-acyltransferase-1